MTIDNWQEYISSLQDKQFFSIMRLYLGEIKTPYNKQRLISQLASFIRNEENSAAIISLLDDFDLKLLSAINFIPYINQNTLLEFFSNEYEPTKIYTGLMNLTERLIIYTNKDYSKDYIYINPLLEDRIKPLLSINRIILPPQIALHAADDYFSLTPNFIISFISYMKIQKCGSKLDGSLKKTDLRHLEEVFPGKKVCIQYLTTAFMNLSLLHDKNGIFEIDSKRLDLFSNLSELHQYAFLSAAAVSRFSREGLKKEATLLLDCLASMPECGCTRENFVRLAFIINSSAGSRNTSSVKSRFSKLLDSARSAASMEESLNNANLLERMLDSAIEFGLLQLKGYTEEKQEIYKANPNILTSEANKECPKVLNIDSTFTVTLMPGLALKELLPLSDFMIIKKYGLVTEFEVSRKTLSYFFDCGKNPDDLFKLISKVSYYDVPQNLKANIYDWYASYTSAVLYKGYVLKVTESNIALVENNPRIKGLLKEKLAEGIYLLNIPVNGDISTFLMDSGLELLGAIKSPEIQGEQLAFPVIRPSYNIFKDALGVSFQDFDDTDNSANLDTSVSNNLIATLNEYVEKSDFDKHQKESLFNRISRRLIVSLSQLKVTALRSEILEADGMDFSGKLHLIEAAIKESDLLEVTLPDYSGKKAYFTLVGSPLGLSKTDEEAILRISVQPSDTIENVIVSRITFLRRLRF